ncbi:MAG: PCRF domain-containing protein, partial [Limisphaerales bacterium]
MDLRPYIENFRRRFAELEMALADPKLFDNPQKAQETTREYSRMKDIVAACDRYLKVTADLASHREMLKTEAEGSELA